jgi:hypothetical protein
MFIFSSVVVDPAFQKASLVYKKILNGFYRFLIELAKADIFIVDMSARAVSDIGVRICQSLNMTNVASGFHVKTFYANLFPPSLKIISDKNTRLQFNQLYLNKYRAIHSTLSH